MVVARNVEVLEDLRRAPIAFQRLSKIEGDERFGRPPKIEGGRATKQNV